VGTAVQEEDPYIKEIARLRDEIDKLKAQLSENRSLTDNLSSLVQEPSSHSIALEKQMIDEFFCQVALDSLLEAN